MRKALALTAALVFALGMAGCGGTEEAPLPEATPAPAFYEAGTQAAERGDHAAAVEAFSQAIEADDDRARAYLGRADSYMALAEAEDRDAPDLRGMARRDYALALSLDPDLGPQVYEVYTALAEQALAAGSVDEGLSCLSMALSAASGEDAQAIREQAASYTGRILTGSVWYMDAPDSCYYEFFDNGTGRVVTPEAMEVSASLTYENDGFVLHIAEDGGETREWTYDPDRESYYTEIDCASAEGGTMQLRLLEAPARRLYDSWRAAILGMEADGGLNWTDDAARAEGAGTLYESAYGLMEALAMRVNDVLTDGQSEALAAAWNRHASLQGEGGNREDYEQVMQLTASLLEHLPADDAGTDTVLDELFPVGEDVLLDYFRLLTGWTVDAKVLALPGDAADLAPWDTLADVEHFFRDGRLYLCLPGYALCQVSEGGGPALSAAEGGRFCIETPLTVEADVSLAGDELVPYLSRSGWVSLTDMGSSTEVFTLELLFDEDMSCSDRGGYYPGDMTAQQSGRYALDGRALTLVMAAEGYEEESYLYEVIPMGESLYMRLLSNGIVYGHAPGETYLFCGTGYAAGVSEYMG